MKPKTKEELITHLEESVINDYLDKKLLPRLEAREKAQSKEVLHRLEGIDRIFTVHVEQTNDDRKDFGEMKIILATIEQSQKEVLDVVSNIKNTVDKMALTKENDSKKLEEFGQKVDKVPHMARQGVKSYIERVKPKVVKVAEKRKSFWSKLKFWRIWTH